MSLSNPIRVAILGARGIGSVHARIFKELGADVCAILGSTNESAKEVSEILHSTHGINAKPFSRLDVLLDIVRPDAVSICSPHHLHFDQTLEALDRNIPVFCEKPLFWYDGITSKQINNSLSQLETHPNRRIFVNTSNVSFVDSVLEEFSYKQKETRSFFFRFHTKGDYHFRNIAIDLMPHAFSMLLRLTGKKKISCFIENTNEHFYSCRFLYGSVEVEFDFSENPAGPKELVFAIDGREFKRISKGSGTTYRVFLKDSYTKKVVEVEDPFIVYIRNFLNNCKRGFAPMEDSFLEAATNMRLMSDALLG